MSEGMLTEFAPAKLNLDLLVTGRRDDGWHELDSMVLFAPVGDTVGYEPADRLSLEITGPFAADLAADDDNLVLRAAHCLASHAGRPATGRLVLEKHLPVASGIGAGSADAAATLRLLDRAWGLGLGNARLRDLGASLGADVPVCVYARPARMRGTGERLDPLRGLPPLAMVLVNPGVASSTVEVFRALAAPGGTRDGGILPNPGPLVLVRYLTESRNDLEAPAMALRPTIGKALAVLRSFETCALARMSGSGATCFGLFLDIAKASQAAELIARAAPSWWVRAVEITQPA